MKHARVVYFVLLGFLISINCLAQNQQPPRLILTADGVQALKGALGKAPLLDASYDRVKRETDRLIAAGISVPVPKDAGGGKTHEQHKLNYKAMHQAGILFQVTGDKKYLEFVRDMLKAYASLYPSLGLHPQRKEQTPGKLFWQSLNDCVWLVYTIQAYDAIRGHITPKEVKQLDEKLFLPAARFLSEGSAETFDRIHNHGTWAVAAVGMTGYVLKNKDLVEKSLLGLDKSGKGGFIAQLNQLFSPDGYYTEGPYYQRYALMPFVVFAQSIDNNEPHRKIFSHRDSILLKAIQAGIHLTYENKFFPFNDALKEKDLRSVELVYASNIGYAHSGDPGFLDIVQRQREVTLSREGVKVALAVAGNQTKPFPFRSIEFRDGAQGTEGAVGILRSGHQPGHQALLMKYTSQGMGHGHYDKLTWMFYDNGKEIVQDYGAARFLNVEAKYGGHYLPENNSWAKQTVAHNTVLVNEESHFKGDFKEGMKRHPTPLLFDISRLDFQIMSAEMKEVYAGVDFTRTMCMIRDEAFEQPIILDVFEVRSKNVQQQYDLPLYFQGHIIDTNVDLKVNTGQLAPLGTANGYEHLWLLAKGAIPEGTAQLTWLNDNRFYTYSTIGEKGAQLLLTRIGANDPSFNLRNEPGLMIRRKEVSQPTVSFVSVLEPHGEFNAIAEYTKQPQSQIKSLRLEEFEGKKVVYIETRDGKTRAFALSSNLENTASHELKVKEGSLSWQGPFQYFKLKN